MLSPSMRGQRLRRPDARCPAIPGIVQHASLCSFYQDILNAREDSLCTHDLEVKGRYNLLGLNME